MSRRYAIGFACIMVVCAADRTQVRADDDQPSHWLGLVCSPADSDVLQKLEIKNGLLIEKVVPQSPAANAGIQAGDVLVRFDQSIVKEVYQLQRLVNEHKDQTVSVQLLRDGNPLTIKVAIAKRPHEIQLEPPDEKPAPKQEPAEREEIKVKARKAQVADSLEARLKAAEARAQAAEDRAKAAEAKARRQVEGAREPTPLERRSNNADEMNKIKEYAKQYIKSRDIDGSGFLERNKGEWSEVNSENQKADVNNDGVITLDELTAKIASRAKTGGSTSGSPSDGGPPRPKNMRVVIGKVGDKPAQATIERDGQKWEVTEETLDKLPQELRDHVRELLRKTATGEQADKKVNVKQNRILTLPGGGQRIEIQIEEGDAKPQIHVERIEQTERRAGGQESPAIVRVIKAESSVPRNLEQRLDEIERKLDTILKSLNDSTSPPKKKKNRT